jgi:subtilisin-like proprotein convertase family protein
MAVPFHNAGFGIVDAAAAVDASRNWTNFGPEKELTVRSGALASTIADDPTIPNIHIMSVDGNESLVVESVEVYLELQHASRGDLSIVLTSPAGTDSLLLPGKRPENQQFGENETWKLMTVRTGMYRIPQ